MNPITIMILIAVVLIGVQLILTARSSRETRSIRMALMADAKRRARRTFAVIIPLARRAETIFPLLNHLQAQHYDKLQIVVLVKQTAGRNAEKDLQAYRKASKIKGLKVVRYTAGSDISKLTANQYVLEMQPADRLTVRFFEIASLVLATHQPDALSVRRVTLPDHTFADAYRAGGVLLRTIMAAIAPRSLPVSRTIVRRVALQKVVAPMSIASYQFGVYDSTKEAITFKQRIATIAVGALLYGALTLAFILSDPQLLPVMVAYLIGAYVLLVAIIFTAIRGYRFIDCLNMLLFVPIAPLYALGSIVTRRRK